MSKGDWSATQYTFDGNANANANALNGDGVKKGIKKGMKKGLRLEVLIH